MSQSRDYHTHLYLYDPSSATCLEFSATHQGQFFSLLLRGQLAWGELKHARYSCQDPCGGIWQALRVATRISLLGGRGDTLEVPPLGGPSNTPHRCLL